MEDVRRMLPYNHTSCTGVEFSFVDCLHPEEDGGSNILRNAGKYLPVYKIHPRKAESSINTHVHP